MKIAPIAWVRRLYLRWFQGRKKLSTNHVPPASKSLYLYPDEDEFYYYIKLVADGKVHKFAAVSKNWPENSVGFQIDWRNND